VAWGRADVNDLAVIKFGSQDQPILAKARRRYPH